MQLAVINVECSIDHVFCWQEQQSHRFTSEIGLVLSQMQEKKRLADRVARQRAQATESEDLDLMDAILESFRKANSGEPLVHHKNKSLRAVEVFHLLPSPELERSPPRSEDQGGGGAMLSCCQSGSGAYADDAEYGR